jgi:hypothetical protein
MIQLDEERRKLLVIRKSIANLETALDQIREHANDLEEKFFDIWELEQIKRKVK